MLQKMKLEVARETLLLVAGFVWTGVGIMLCAWAYVWLRPVPVIGEIGFGLAGVGIAAVAWRFMFARLAQANIERIERAPLRACVFSFQAWKSYAVTAGMIALGLVLRHSALPKPWLAMAYEGIGGALLLASIGYYTHFRRLLTTAAAGSGVAS